MQLVTGLDFHTSTIEDLDRDASWLALMNEVRHPGAHAPTSATDCERYIERRLSTQHVYLREEEWEVACRDVIDKKRTKTECVIILRGHPTEIGVREKNVRLHSRVVNQRRQSS